MQKVVYITLDSFLPRPTFHLAFNINTRLPSLMPTHLSVLYLLNLQTHSVPAAQTDTSIFRMAVLWSAEGERKRNLLGLNTKALC